MDERIKISGKELMDLGIELRKNRVEPTISQESLDLMDNVMKMFSDTSSVKTLQEIKAFLEKETFNKYQ